MPPSPEIIPMQHAPPSKNTSQKNAAPKANLSTTRNAVEPYSAFPNTTRTYLTYILGVIQLISTLTTTIYFPLIPTLSTHFSVSIQAINLTVTVYAICQALSPGIFGSLADSYGRRPVLLGLVTTYTLASLGLALNKKSYPVLITLRALQSIGGSATVPIAYGIVADVAVVSERGGMLGPMLATCNGISASGPVIGGALAMKSTGHMGVFIALLGIAILCLVLVGFVLPETSRSIVGNGGKPATGVWRTWISFLGRENGDQLSASGTLQHEPVTTPKFSQTFSRVFDSIRMIRHPDAAVILWMVASSYGIYYTFQVAHSVIFKELYGYNELQIGLSFLPALAGMTIGGTIAGKLMDINYAYHARQAEVLDPANVLDFPIERARFRNMVPLILAEIALVTGYGWTVQRHTHPAVPLVLEFFVSALATLLSHTANALLVDVFPEVPSTAYASGQLARGGFSAASAAIIDPLVRSVDRGWYFTIFAAFTGLGCLTCVSLSRWAGMRWRRKRYLNASSRSVDRASGRGV
jgi:MFS family permease